MQTHVLISTNKWFSAVNESCLQLALALRDGGAKVVCASHEESPLQAIWKSRALSTTILPLLGGGAWGWLRTWKRVSLLLSGDRKDSDVDNPAPPALSPSTKVIVDNFVDNSRDARVIWVFEGREHSLCALHRLLRPGLWKGWRLVRMRGQASGVRDSAVNRFFYRKGIDALVCAARVVTERIPFYDSIPNAQVFPFCSRSVREALGLPPGERPHTLSSLRSLLPPWSGPLSFLPDSPAIDAELPLFLVVGRFDPVKGHASLLEAVALIFERSPPPRPFQLVLAGRSENIHSHDLARKAQELWNGTINGHGVRQFVEAFGGRLRLFLYDEKLPGIVNLMERAHFGVIPSLASEVICRVAVEFLQAGTPLVSSNAGALVEVIPADAGLFYRAGDVEALAGALALALRTLEDGGAAHARLRACAFEAGWGLYADGCYVDLVRDIVSLR